MLFQPFNTATKAETPQFGAAAAREGQLDQAAQEYENAQKQQALFGGANIYNEAMNNRGESPIADYLFGGPESVTPGVEAATGLETLGGPAGTAGMAPGVPGAAVATEAAMPAMLSAGAGGPVAAGAGGGAMAAPAAVGAGTGTAAATPALASMGPAGWAALAAMALYSLG